MFRKVVFLSSLASLLTTMATASPMAAQSGGGFDLTWRTIGGGGGVSAGGSYTLSGTLGQPDAGAMSGGAFTLIGGVWSGTVEYNAYVPIITR